MMVIVNKLSKLIKATRTATASDAVTFAGNVMYPSPLKTKCNHLSHFDGTTGLYFITHFIALQENLSDAENETCRNYILQPHKRHENLANHH